MISVRDFLKAVIGTWEGLYSGDPDDPGNYANGRLVGSMRGVTPPVLAKFRGVSIDTITVDVMKSVSLDEAANIGYMGFYVGPHFDLLTWCPATAALLDFGWGAGSGQAVKSMQRLVGVNADGGLGPITAKAYNEWVSSVGDEAIVGNRLRNADTVVAASSTPSVVCRTKATLSGSSTSTVAASAAFWTSVMRPGTWPSVPSTSS